MKYQSMFSRTKEILFLTIPFLTVLIIVSLVTAGAVRNSDITTIGNSTTQQNPSASPTQTLSLSEIASQIEENNQKILGDTPEQLEIPEHTQEDATTSAHSDDDEHESMSLTPTQSTPTPTPTAAPSVTPTPTPVNINEITITVERIVPNDDPKRISAAEINVRDTNTNHEIKAKTNKDGLVTITELSAHAVFKITVTPPELLETYCEKSTTINTGVRGSKQTHLIQLEESDQGECIDN